MDSGARARSLPELPPGSPSSATAPPTAATASDRAGQRRGAGAAAAITVVSSSWTWVRGVSATVIAVGGLTCPFVCRTGAAGPTATLRSDSVTGSSRAAASAARPRSPADG